MNKDKDVICFYHANCTDGAAAAAVIKHKYSDAKLYPVNHGQPAPVSVAGKKLFILDFSFDAETLRQFKSQASSVHWYDHHKTALPIQEQLGWGVINLSESGASLTWKQEFPDQPLPKILAYVRDKDLYEWKLPNSRAISMELSNMEGSLDPESEVWKRFLNSVEEAQWQRMVERGQEALRLRRMSILQAVKNGFEIEFHGHRAFAVNYVREASDIGEYIYKELGYPVAIIFYYNGEQWVFSLRSDKIDVSELALQHGGGGHPGAAGFRSAEIDWLLKLKKL